MKKIEFVSRKITDGDVAAIARLLHLTDPYIYPTVCEDPEDPLWRRVVSLCLKAEGNVFSAAHFRILTVENAVVALSCVIPCGKGLSFAENLPLTERERAALACAEKGYFLPLLRESAEMNGFNLVNLCVDPAVRGQGAGRMLMELYVREHGDAPLHLDVVADNIGAIRLYESCGFQIERAYEGFAGEGATVACYHMVRPSPRGTFEEK